MNAITGTTYTYGNGELAHSPVRAPKASWGLGPNQLTWLRRNIESFKHAEEQRYQLRQDAVRAARLAGLI